MSSNRRRHSRSTSNLIQPVAGGPGRRSGGVWWYVCLLVIAGTLTYANSVSNPFVLDDEITIGDNEQIRDLTSSAVLMPERELPTAGRPVVNLTFAINYALGELNVAGYRAVNILLHVLCALVLFGLVRRTLLLEGSPPRLVERATPLAFAVAVLWLVHPLNSEVVNYLTQRTESMMGLCYLLTLYASLRAAQQGRAATMWAVIAVLTCAIGMGSKEVMATAPLAVVLFDRAFIYGSLRAAWAARWRLYTGLATTWLIVVGLQAMNPRPFSAGFGTDVSPWTYLLNQPALITRYLGLALWPQSLVASYGWPATVTVGQAAPYALLLVGMLAATVYALWRWPRAGFLGAVYFLTLAPSSSIVPIATEVGAERRMYLALAALIVLVVLAVERVWDAGTSPAGAAPRRVSRGALVAPMVLVVLTTVLAATTAARNREYRSAVTLAEVTLERYPTPVIHHTLAEALIKAGRRDEALAHLRQALPGAPRAHYTLGVELFKDGRLAEAIPELQAFIRAQPRLVHVIEAHGYWARPMRRSRTGRRRSRRSRRF